MKANISLFVIYYKQNEEFRQLVRIVSTDSETAMKEARNICKNKLKKLKITELFYQQIPLTKNLLKTKDPA